MKLPGYMFYRGNIVRVFVHFFDCLDTLKEILAQTEKIDLLKEVEEFEQRLSRELKFEMRKGIN